MNTTTNFIRVEIMNEAFGNERGDPQDIEWGRVRKQCMNMPDEMAEIFIALGADPGPVRAAAEAMKAAAMQPPPGIAFQVNPDGVRDGLCDTHVFAYGAHHFMGLDADRDMEEVVEAVMTRFIKDDDDKAATIAMHAAKGVTEVYFEGQYPTMIMKSAVDQPDAPQGKFLKSASYREPVFRAVSALAPWPSKLVGKDPSERRKAYELEYLGRASWMSYTEWCRLWNSGQTPPQLRAAEKAAQAQSQATDL